MKFTFSPESRPLEGFTIKRAIYRGGFGEVYYAQSDAGREVALKLLQNNSEVELRGVQQCLNLSHPNLVTIFDIRQDGDGDHWIVMEYVAGETLDATLRRSPEGMPVEKVRKWLAGMTSGLSYLHSRGLVHRDLKPANLFMENGVVKIGDVGLSKFIAPSRHSAQTQSVGTVHYMAPEVAKGRYGREVDVYAVGVILYEMLTGTLPFDGESTGEILMKHLSEPPNLDKLPPRLRGVIAKSLEKDPEKRFSRIEALQRAFDDAVLGITPEAAAESSFAKNNPDRRGDGKRSQLSPVSNESPAHSAKVASQSRRRFPNWGVGVLVGLFTYIVLGAFFGLARGPSMLGSIALGVIVSVILKTRSSSTRLHAPQRSLEAPAKVVKARPHPAIRRQATASNILGSLFATVPVSASMIACLAFLKPSILGDASSVEALEPAVVGLFTVTTLLASWTVLLLPAFYRKSNHNKKLPQVHFVLGGAVVGALAYFTDQYLMAGSLGGPSQAMFKHLGEQPLFAADAPTLLGYIAFFATMLGLRNWQEMTSQQRDKRFSVSAVFITLFAGWFASLIFAFPQEMGMAWAVLIACVTQLTAPLNKRSAAPRSRRLA